MVRGTFSPARAWRPAVAARLARTLGGTGTTFLLPACKTAMSTPTALNTPDIAEHVVRALVLYALAEFQSGNATTLCVYAEGTSFSVSDDGRGHAIDRTVDGSTYLPFIYTHLQYPFVAVEGGPVQIHGIGMSLLNALCVELSVSVRKKTETLSLTYRAGHLHENRRTACVNEATGNTVSGMVNS